MCSRTVSVSTNPPLLADITSRLYTQLPSRNGGVTPNAHIHSVSPDILVDVKTLLADPYVNAAGVVRSLL